MKFPASLAVCVITSSSFALGCGASGNPELDDGAGGTASAGKGGGTGNGGSPVNGGSAGSSLGGGGTGAGGASSGGSNGGNGNAHGGSAAAGAAGDTGNAGGAFVDCETPPEPSATALVPGVWTNVSPPVDLEESAAGVLCVAVDPCTPGIVYAGMEKFGIWKSTDSGLTWAQLGDPSDSQNYDNVEEFLDMPINLFVDPADSLHLYATQGVRGRTAGFFVSTDGGNVWTRPQGFTDVSPTNDVTTLAVDPADFEHVLVGSHTQDPIGVLESTDGGASWVLHPPPAGGFGGAGSYGVSFLYHPASGTGDKDTWLVQHNGLWRTTNAGGDWTKVNPSGGVHHGTDRAYYTDDGVVYTGGSNYPLKSTDNGLTWKTLTDGIPSYTYHTIHGDGQHLYTLKSAYYGAELPFLASSDGEHFAAYEHEGETPTFFQGPIQMRFDATNRILYSAHWEAQGLWALKSEEP